MRRDSEYAHNSTLRRGKGTLKPRQVRKAEARGEWKSWGWTTYFNWAELETDMALDPGKEAICMRCKNVFPIRAMRMDHVDPVFQFPERECDPTNGQPLCNNCNGIKESESGPEWDFRPVSYKKYLTMQAQLDWTKTHAGWRRR